jgi:hypothetical protein
MKVPDKTSLSYLGVSGAGDLDAIISPLQEEHRG